MQTKDRERVNKKTGKVTVVRGSTPSKEGVGVIKEDTTMEQLRHFCEVCKERWGITQLQIQWNMPIAFGVLTVGDMQQALDRCGGRHGNKGDEAAATAINMVKLQIDMEAASPAHAPDRRNIN